MRELRLRGGRSWTKATQLGLHTHSLWCPQSPWPGPGASWGWLGVLSKSPKDHLFSVQGPDPAWGWGGLDPCLRELSGPARPCEGLGRRQGSSQGPLTWQEEEGKGPCRVAGEGQSLASPDPGRGQPGQGWGRARPAQRPRWDWGLSGGSGGRECQRPYLAGWGLLISSPFGGMMGGGKGLIHSTRVGSRGQSAPWGPAETWKLRERGETWRKRQGVRGDGERGLEKQSGADQQSWEGRGADTQLGEWAGERARRPKLQGGWSACLPPRLGFL